MAAVNDLWTEAYRPKTVDEYVFTDDKQRAQVEYWIKSKSLPHTIFSGPAGTGKTSMAKLLIRQLNIDPYDVLVINASRERGIDVIRDTIKNFASTMPFGDLKVILLDEAESLTPAAQASLKGTMEEYSSTVRFILTTNHPSNIIAPIHSRCQGFRFERLDHTEFTARAATVLVTENIEFDIDTLDLFVKATYPDLRKCLNSLQLNSTSGTLLKPGESDSSACDYRIDAVDLFKKGRLREARTLLCKSLGTEDIDDMYKWMYDNLDIWSELPDGQDEAILIIRKAIVNSKIVADQEINLSAALVELSQIGRQ